MIYWFTGQPGHGKTVLAKALNEKYFENKAFHVDGDDLREIFDNKDYSEAGRRKNIELAQHMSHFLHNKGQDVVVVGAAVGAHTLDDVGGCAEAPRDVAEDARAVRAGRIRGEDSRPRNPHRIGQDLALRQPDQEGLAAAVR